jgi:hypothetical protein
MTWGEGDKREGLSITVVGAHGEVKPSFSRSVRKRVYIFDHQCRVALPTEVE